MRSPLLGFIGTFLLLHTPSTLVLARTPQPCYYDIDTLASDDLLPCYGSTISQHYSCCRAGDKCLENNACYDVDTGVTYLYGCTDPTFRDPHCSSKCNLDTRKSHWVGLVFCNGTEGLPNNQWMCNHPENCGDKNGCAERNWDDSIERPPEVGCEDLYHNESYVAFEASSTLSDIAALPYPSRTASWWSEHADRYQTTGTTSSIVSVIDTTTTSSDDIRTSSATATLSRSGMATVASTSTINPSETTDPAALATSGKKAVGVSIGIGIGLGIPVLLGLAGLTLFYVRRQNKKHKAALSAAVASHPPEKSDAAAFYGHKCELNGTPVCELPGSPQPSELQGSTVQGTPQQSPFVSPETIHEEFGRTERLSAVSAISVEPRRILRVHNPAS